MSHHRYQIQFTKPAATALLEYDEAGNLLKYELDPGQFTSDQFYFFQKRFPYTLERLEKWKKLNFPNVKIRPAERDLSFGHVYELYDYKFGKKQRSKKIWEQMNDVEKAKAIDYIPQYKRHLILTNVNQKYFETFLNQEPWNN